MNNNSRNNVFNFFKSIIRNLGKCQSQKNFFHVYVNKFGNNKQGSKKPRENQKKGKKFPLVVKWYTGYTYDPGSIPSGGL